MIELLNENYHRHLIDMEVEGAVAISISITIITTLLIWRLREQWLSSSRSSSSSPSSAPCWYDGGGSFPRTNPVSGTARVGTVDGGAPAQHLVALITIMVLVILSWILTSSCKLEMTPASRICQRAVLNHLPRYKSDGLIFFTFQIAQMPQQLSLRIIL